MFDKIKEEIENMGAKDIINIVDGICSLSMLDKIEELQAENRKLRECVEDFAYCITCANGHYKDLARQTLTKIKGDA